LQPVFFYASTFLFAYRPKEKSVPQLQQNPGPAFIVGVMGGAGVDPKTEETAFRLGQLIAQNNWVLLNGGRAAGVMHASAKGAYLNGGLTLGILPDDHMGKMSSYIKIPVLTGMGSARNMINVLSSHVVVACKGGMGTLSETALALKHGKPVILLDFKDNGLFEKYHQKGRLFYAHTPEETVKIILDPESGILPAPYKPTPMPLEP
jgi:uncharacterized protein (TIGR00725 family)